MRDHAKAWAAPGFSARGIPAKGTPPTLHLTNATESRLAQSAGKRKD